ncbi:hypothetical protein B0I35DRAFT_408563 [Stachybotrys elegans]|uniref:Uncharacterized protein n=1 Tax=Stachybotrys elegans TaxID=80388 RepID=A0A8K0WR56_9HYPO|nr:hypothetical protein B0I35DRAFT_408563 [Stachybotrys elegans]
MFASSSSPPDAEYEDDESSFVLVLVLVLMLTLEDAAIRASAAASALRWDRRTQTNRAVSMTCTSKKPDMSFTLTDQSQPYSRDRMIQPSVVPCLIETTSIGSSVMLPADIRRFALSEAWYRDEQEKLRAAEARGEGCSQARRCRRPSFWAAAERRLEEEVCPTCSCKTS